MGCNEMIDDLKKVYKNLNASEKEELLDRLNYDLDKLYFRIEEKKKMATITDMRGKLYMYLGVRETKEKIMGVEM